MHPCDRGGTRYSRCAFVGGKALALLYRACGIDARVVHRGAFVGTYILGRAIINHTPCPGTQLDATPLIGH